MKLRPHQELAIQQARESIAKGLKRPVIAAPTAFGKTVVAAYMLKACQDKGKRGWFFCDRVKLVEQTIERFRSMGVDFGVRQADHDLKNPNAPIQIASIQTVQAMLKNHNRGLPEFDMCIVDECFVAGTMVSTTSGIKPIEFVTSGEKIYNAFGVGEVRSIFSKKTKRLVRVKLSDGREIKCTPDHPFFTKKGWTEAGKLGLGEGVFDIQNMPSLWDSLLPKKQWRESGSGGVGVQEKNNMLQILLKEVEQPIKEAGSSKEDFGTAKGDWTQATNTRGERARGNATPEDAKRAARFWMGIGICTDDKNKNFEGGQSPSSLQAGHSEQRKDDSHRGGWWEPLHNREAETRYKEDGDLNYIRVESVEVVESGGGETVYNLRVSGHPSYFVNGILVHNCHVQYDLIRQIAEQYNNIPMIGLSATPYSKGLGKIYSNLIVPITPRELLEKDYLTPVKYYGGDHIDLSKIRSNNANTYSTQDIERETDNTRERLVGDIVKNWIAHGEDSQTIAFSPTVSTSEYLVERLRGSGVSAEHIDCYMSAEEKQDLFEAHDEGEFKVLSCSRLLNTGYDSPTTRCVIDCFPTKSLTTYVQRVGRITRKAEGKDYAIYLDHADNFSKFGYAEDIVPDELHDGEKPHNERELTKEKKEPKTKNCPECNQLMSGLSCVCGYKVVITDVMEDDGTMLVEVGTAANKRDPQNLKDQFYAEMLGYAEEKGRKPGWAAYKYKDKYGVFPSRDKPKPIPPTDLVKGWIKHEAIKRRASQERGKKIISGLKAMFDE